MGTVNRLIKLLTFTFLILRSHANELNTGNGKLCNDTICDVYCPYGNVEINGCKTCECINPCANYSCPDGQKCKEVPKICKRAPCGFSASCGPECPLYKCVATKCPYGYEVDENGCKGCGCTDHCKNYSCKEDQMCVIEELCPFATCGIRPKCVKRCPLSLPCHLTAKCAYGFELDKDNCETCACRDPCAGVICPSAQYCSVTVLNCFVAPCPPPSATCHSYCPENSVLLTGFGDKPVTCTDGSTTCPKGYKCHNVPRLRKSYCCSI